MAASRRPGMVARIVGATSAVSVIAVVIAGLVALPLIRSSALAQSQATLGRLADLTVTALQRDDRRGRGGGPLPRGIEDVLRSEQVEGYLVLSQDAALPGLTPGQVAGLLAGDPLSAVGEVDGGTVLIEGRSLGSGAGALVLLQPVEVAGGAAGAALWRVALALALGLLVAIPIGTLVARRMVRPLRAAHDAAERMAGGARDVRIEPSGPQEIAEIAEALNTLCDALSSSEGRQREFLLSVSHELRTPLTAIRGYGEALSDGLLLGQEVPRTGTTIATEAERLNRLVTDLLDLARMGAVDFRVRPVGTDLQDIMREAFEVWSARCSAEGVSLALEAPEGPMPVRTDPDRVRQIIDNLAENALRIVPAGSRIILAATLDGDEAVIQVRDSGPGIAPEDLEVAFQPGVLHERYRGVRTVGTGLGLAIVQRLARGLGGEAGVSAAPEGGAAFTVRLPQNAPVPAADQGRSAH